MAEAGETKFARNGGVHLAYQTHGQGTRELLVVESWVHHVELEWDLPEQARFLRRLASFGRLIVFDRRGTGLSDPVPLDDLPDLETQVDDALAVLDAVDAERVAVLGLGDGGLLALMLAATHPERCTALVLWGTSARRKRDHGYPWGWTEEEAARTIEYLSESWAAGGIDQTAWLAPSRANDERFQREMGRLSRAAVRPGAVAHYFGQVIETDLRPMLPTIQVPTLVLQRQGDKVASVDQARYLAEHIPKAKLVEFPGTDHLIYTEDADRIADEIEEFLTGVRSGAEPDRILATLLYTDIVGSTTKAADLGDRRWRDLLDAHDVAVRRELERYRGREVVSTGDGFLATFDGPARAVRCGRSVADAMRALGLQVRVGVHTGECEVRGDNVGGLAVHIAARIEALAGPGEVLVSSTVKDLIVGSGIEFEDRGQVTLKGVPGEWHLFAAKA